MSDGPGVGPSEAATLPEIRTARLLLRAFRPDDAARVRELAGEREIAATTTNIPHPYEEGMAEAWIGAQVERRAAGQGVVFAVQLRPDLTRAEDALEPGTLVGAVGLELDPQNRHAELGYWIGRPYWNRGLATEAARAVLRFGFEELSLNRIHAAHFGNNPVSGRVLTRIGMLKEGCRRRHVRKWGRYEDLVLYGVLADEYMQPGSAPSG